MCLLVYFEMHCESPRETLTVVQHLLNSRSRTFRHVLNLISPPNHMFFFFFFILVKRITGEEWIALCLHTTEFWFPSFSLKHDCELFFFFWLWAFYEKNSPPKFLQVLNYTYCPIWKIFQCIVIFLEIEIEFYFRHILSSRLFT